MAAEQDIRQLIEQSAIDARVPCKAMLELAERTGTPPAKIGRLCDEMNLRISDCRLGCFGRGQTT